MTPDNLLSLPLEIRQKIYNFVFSDSRMVLFPSPKCGFYLYEKKSTVRWQLLSSCHKIFEEASELYCQDTLWDLSQCPWTFDQLHLWCGLMWVENVRRLRCSVDRLAAAQVIALPNVTDLHITGLSVNMYATSDQEMDSLPDCALIEYLEANPAYKRTVKPIVDAVVQGTIDRPTGYKLNITCYAEYVRCRLSRLGAFPTHRVSSIEFRHARYRHLLKPQVYACLVDVVKRTVVRNASERHSRSDAMKVASGPSTVMFSR